MVARGEKVPTPVPEEELEEAAETVIEVLEDALEEV
jgi:hypothetical protein